MQIAFQLTELFQIEIDAVIYTDQFTCYKGVSINNQPIPFPMDQDDHDFQALFQYMFYTGVQNCTCIESFFNKILNVKHG